MSSTEPRTSVCCERRCTTHPNDRVPPARLPPPVPSHGRRRPHAVLAGPFFVAVKRKASTEQSHRELYFSVFRVDLSGLRASMGGGRSLTAAQRTECGRPTRVTPSRARFNNMLQEHRAPAPNAPLVIACLPSASPQAARLHRGADLVGPRRARTFDPSMMKPIFSL